MTREFARCRHGFDELQGDRVLRKTDVYSLRKLLPTAAESSHSSWTEIAPETFWQALVAVTRGIAAEVNRDPVEVLAISSHGETFVPVDSRYRVIRPAILNVDNRAVKEANWLASEIGKKKIFNITGLTVHSMYPLAKILWLRKNEPDTFNSSAQFLALPTYLLTKMGLPAFVDYSLASRFLAFDICQLNWSVDILSALRIECRTVSHCRSRGHDRRRTEARVGDRSRSATFDSRRGGWSRSALCRSGHAELSSLGGCQPRSERMSAWSPHRKRLR